MGNVIYYPTPGGVGGGGTVTSVAFVGDGIITSATPSTPVITSGNIVATLLTQSANTVLAGPTTGAAATPTFRALVMADMPAGLALLAGPAFTGVPTAPTATLGTNTTQIATTAFVLANSGSGTVKSVTFTGDGTILSSTPSTAVTVTGTVTATLLTQSANLVLAGPATGAAANPTFRALVTADMPASVALLSGPSLSGTPTAPTAAPGTNTTQLATTAFVLANAGGTTAVTQPVGNNTTLIASTAFVQQNQFRRTTRVSTDGASTTFQVMGEAAPTVTGSTIQAKAFSTGLGPAINATTNSGSTAQGFSSPAANYKTGKNLTFFCIGWLNAIATERAWFGITDQSMATMVASDNPAGNYAAFRYSNGIGVTDTSWQCITKDGSTQNIIASGVAPVTGVFQKFLIIFNDAAATITFYINDVLVGTSSSHLPTAATSVNWVMGSFTTSSGSFQNGIALNQLIVMTDI